jgi:hypothetical protein
VLLFGQEIAPEVTGQQVDSEPEGASSFRSVGIANLSLTDRKVMLRATLMNTVWQSPMKSIGGCRVKNW